MPNPSANSDLIDITLAASPATQSAFVPIGNPAELGLYVPALAPSSTVQVLVAQDAAGTGAAAVFDSTGTQKLIYASGAGGFAIGSNDMGACLAYSHIGVLVGTAQTTGKTFKLARKLSGVDPTV